MGQFQNALGGAGTGASIGSAFGPIGTAVGGVVGAVGGLITGNAAEKKQKRQQRALNDQAAATNYEYNEMAAENAYARTMKMYERELSDNSPAAQRKRLEDAGMSVGLMYGGAGTTGGANVGQMAQGAGASGAAQAGQATREAESRQLAIQQQGIALQASKMASEIDLNKANAEALRADAEKKKGVDTELAETTIKSITEDIKNKEIQRLGMKIQNRIDGVKANINEATLETQIWKIEAEYELLEEQITKAIRENEIGEEMLETTKATMKAQLENLLADTIQKIAGTALTNEQRILLNKEFERSILDRKVDMVKFEAMMGQFGLKLSQEQVNIIGGMMNTTIRAFGGITGAQILKK